VDHKLQVDILYAAYGRLCRRAERNGLASLRWEERVFKAVFELDMQVNSGGFDSWMRYYAGEEADFVIAAFQEVGAVEMAGVARQMFALIVDGPPSADYSVREKQLQRTEEVLGEDGFEDAVRPLEERFWYELSGDLQTLLVAYVRKHRLMALRHRLLWQ
jgi:hypothetical protein